MTTDNPRTLEARNFPLRGRQLIEASAGTGKTFTIASLYVRLVLGHGDKSSSFGRSLMPDKILVVTFTNAATRELRDRIRKRLADAARVFRRQSEGDDFLQSLLSDPEYASAESRALAARKLEQAAEWMDEAAIYTIHGWCQRMLTQHALDTGSLFRQQLEQNDHDLQTEMARDYWRQWFYTLPDDTAEAMSELLPDPDSLLQMVKPLLKPGDWKPRYQGKDLAEAISPAEYASRLQHWLVEKNRLEDRARALWKKDREHIEAELTRAVESKILNNNSYRPGSLPGKLAEMAAWAEGEPLKADQLAYFGLARLTEKTAKKKQGQTPHHAAFEQLQQLVDHLQQKPPLQPLLQHAADCIQKRFNRARERAATLGFNDMLTRLGQALDEQEGRDALVAAIRKQYPVALIDEFQDTDPLQYRIFSRIYADCAEDEPDDRDRAALLMIGDPKQAIYAFRGADIHTYLRAREDTRGNHHTLGRNYRSSRPLVEAVNRLFEQAEQSQPAGAFRFAGGGENPLPFIPVDAKGREENLLIEGETPAALTCWLLEGEEEKGISVSAYRQQMAEHAASEICRLLTLAQQRKAGFTGSGSELTALRPGDIAVLVRNGKEADAIRGALRRRNINSVYLSDKASVYAGMEAEDLWRWLCACAEPEQPGLLQAALASTTLDLDYAQLERLTRDEKHWEATVEQFRTLREIWQRQGVLPMIRHLLDQFELPARLLQKPGGERVLTNLLHLAELLQAASSQLEGEQALIRYLQEQILDPGQAGEEQIMRLESDADLVQVVTIHKSKGLEYPLVFLPFICTFHEVTAKEGSYRYHTEQGSVLELDSTNRAAREKADEERLQEDLRLLYVALTRPVYACWLGVAAITKRKSPCVHKSGLGQLLGCESKTDSAALRERLQALASPGLISVESPSEINNQLLDDSEQENSLSPARTCEQPVVRDRWWIASYTAISRLQGRMEEEELAEAEPVESARDETARESRDEPPTLSLPEQQTQNLHQFWKGPQAGTFLHGVLEWAAGEGFDRVAENESLRKDFLAPRCQRRAWQGWLSVLSDWLWQLLTTPLPLGEQTLSLTQLQVYQAEMEFWLEVAPVSVHRLDQLITEQVLPGQVRPALAPQQLGGMLKGYIDLIFEYEGRYWVADYKSNWLGNSDSDYSLDGMRRTVLNKRYDVQYVLYLLALHRLLKARMPGYTDDPVAGYEQHVGGALYLFLRGIGEPVWHGCCVDRPPGELIETLDRLLANGEVTHG